MLKNVLSVCVAVVIVLALLRLAFAVIPHSSPITATVTVTTRQVYQTISGLGGNYAQGRFDGRMSSRDAIIGAYNVNQLHPPYVRVGIPIKAWEPSRGTFDDSGPVHQVFLLLRYLYNHRIHIVASIWDVPDWMVSNPLRRAHRLIPQSSWPEAIASIAQFLLRARKNYGVIIDDISFNEPDAGTYVYFSSSDYANFIALAGPRFARFKLVTKWLVGDTSAASALVAYARPILQNDHARPYLGPIAFHSWDNPSPSTLRDIVLLAHQYEKPIWCTEVGINSQAWQYQPSPFPTWTYAWMLARTYYNLLHYGQISVGLYWQYQNDYPLMSANHAPRPYPAFYVIKQLVDNLPPGSRIVGVSSSDARVVPLAARAATHFMVQVINAGGSDVQVDFHGLPTTRLTLVRTSASERMHVAGAYTATGGSLALMVPARSIGTLTT